MSQQTPFSAGGASIIRRGWPFIKMHGLRNDFVIVDGRREPYQPTAEEIIRICDRREGVGGDELVIVAPPGSFADPTDAYACVKIFNPDGREVEACGNATRCIGWLLLQESAASGDENEVAYSTEVMVDAARRGRQLVNDLLTLSWTATDADDDPLEIDVDLALKTINPKILRDRQERSNFMDLIRSLRKITPPRPVLER